jgi:3-hydroxyisobutyrate dehydrogenase
VLRLACAAAIHGKAASGQGLLHGEAGRNVMASTGRTDGREKLGYLGLGLMGIPMTRRLLNAGHDVTVWNRSAGKAARLIEAGATLAATPRDVAASAGIVFMCLTDAAAVEQVVFGPDGIAFASGAAKLVVDFSSIHPDAARAIAARLKAANGMGWIDAPVSGGTKGAEEGTLAVMAGGDAADIERARPYVLAMARRFTHMGPSGAGQTTKLCNQIISGCSMAVIAEATRLASNAGIDASKLPEALAGGFADSIPLQLFVPRMAKGIHSPPLGHIASILKDLDTVVEVAHDTSTPVPMTALAAQLFRMAKAARGADADALEIYKLSEKRKDS